MQASDASAQVHPVPLIPVAVRPLGKASLSVTVPEVDAVPVLLTEIVYCAPT